MASDEEYFLAILLRILWKSLYKYGNGKGRIIAKYRKVKHFGDIIFECSNQWGNSIQLLEIQNMYTKDKRRTTEALSYRCDRLKLESYFETYCNMRLRLNDQMLSPFEKNTYIRNFLIVKNNDISLEAQNLFQRVPFSETILHHKIKFLVEGVELTKFDKTSKPPQFKNINLLKLKSEQCEKLLKPFTDRSEMAYEKILETLADLICDGAGGKSFHSDGPKVLRPYLYALKREVFEVDPVNKTKLKLRSDFLKSQKQFCGDLMKEILFRKDVKILCKRPIKLVMFDSMYSTTTSIAANLAKCLRDGCTEYSYHKKYDSLFKNEIFHTTNNSAQGFRKAFIYMGDNNVKLSPTALKFRRPFINYMYCKYGGKTVNEEVLKSIRVERGDHVELIKEKQLPLPVSYLHAFVSDFASVFQIIVNYPDAPELNQLLLAEIRQEHPDETKLLTLLMQTLRERLNKKEKNYSFNSVDIENVIKAVERK